MAELEQERSETYDAIADAASLMLRCVGMEFDRQQAKSGWKIFYAIDVDVIALYLSPEDNPAYAEVFRGEGEDTRVLLARLLGDYIFGEYETAAAVPGAKRGALFIAGPHHEELARMIHALSEKVLEHERTAWEKLDQLLQAEAGRLQNISGSGDVAKWLIDEAPGIIEAFDRRSGPGSELSRFAALGDSRLMNLEQYFEGGSAWRFPLPKLGGRLKDFELFTKSVDTWKSRLVTHKTRDQSRRAVTTDAYVMATIEWVNRAMGAQKRRLVLVTGTKGILNASAEYATGAAEYPRNFADSFVRHPQAFMIDRSFFTRTETPSGNSDSVGVMNVRGAAEAFRLIEWLNLLFPGVLKEEPGMGPLVDTAMLLRVEAAAKKEFDEAVKLLSAAQVGRNIDFFRSLQTTWRTQVSTASLARRIDPPAAWPKRAMAFLTWLGQELDQNVDSTWLRTALANRAMKSMEALYSSTVWLGLWSRLSTHLESLRGIPALRLEPEYPKAQEYCRKVLDIMRRHQGSTGSTSAPLFDMAAMYKELSEGDDSHYHAHLIHALAYATKGHWFATRTLARVALRTADLLPEEMRGNRRGREAAYLLAISERRLARTTTDIDRAEQYLQEAPRRESPGASADIRFPSEGLAEKVARINFDVFMKKQVSATAGVLGQVMLSASHLLELAKADPLDEARKWVRQQVLVNVLNLALITVAFGGVLTNSELAEIRGFVEIAEAHKKEQESNLSNWDDVAEFVYLVATVVFGTDEKVKERARMRLKTLHFPASLPFDREREKTFRALCEKA